MISERQWQLHGFFTSIQRNAGVHPFDKKNTKTWKCATEAALEVIGALNICVICAVKRNYCRRTVKVETV